MAYTKKYNYPSLRKPGVYPPGSIKEHGLNTDNLEKFSLGNWSELDENKKQLWFGLPPNEVIQVDEEDVINPFNLAHETNITVEEAKSQDFQIFNHNDSTYLLTLGSGGSFKMFLLQNNNWVNHSEWNIGDDWDATAEGRINVYNAFYLHPEGTKMYLVGRNTLNVQNAGIVQYDLHTAYDFQTPPTRVYQSIIDQAGMTGSQLHKQFQSAMWNPVAITFGDDGNKLYILEGGSGIFGFDDVDDDDDGTPLTTLHSHLFITDYWENFPLHTNPEQYLRGGNLVQINLTDAYELQAVDFNHGDRLRKKTIPLRLKTSDKMLQQATETSYFTADLDFESNEVWLPADDIPINDIESNQDLIDGHHYLTYPVDMEFTQDGLYLFVLYNGYFSYEGRGGGWGSNITYEDQLTQSRIVRYKLKTSWDFKRTTNRDRSGMNLATPEDEINLGYIKDRDENKNEADRIDRTEDLEDKIETIVISNFTQTNALTTPSYTTLSDRLSDYGTQYKLQLINNTDTEKTDLWIMSKPLNDVKGATVIPIASDLIHPNFDIFSFDPFIQEAQDVNPSYNLGMLGEGTVQETDRINNDDEIELEDIDYYINTKSKESQTELLYYGQENNDEKTFFENTTYPLAIEVNVDIYSSQQEVFDNRIEVTGDNVLDYPSGFSDTDFLTGVSPFENGITFPDVTLAQSYFTYRIIAWGDEKIKIKDDTIKDSFYFNHYTESAEDYLIKKNILTQAHNAKPIQEITTHIYNTPGVKSIKIIVFRYTRDKRFLVETTLINRNIVINDGTLTSQDFSIFGGTDFNFLPLSNKEAIIGGLDEDSKYNNSVEKIKKDDNFIQDDYLERASSRDFIDNFNNELFGKSPGQLDLGINRMFKGSYDIYDFITDNKGKIVQDEFEITKLPINSSATDIFIDDENCIVELVPQELEYLTIPNEVGTNTKAILIGDYKVKQPKDGAIQRAGVMQTPLLEKNQDKQAF